MSIPSPSVLKRNFFNKINNRFNNTNNGRLRNLNRDNKMYFFIILDKRSLNESQPESSPNQQRKISTEKSATSPKLKQNKTGKKVRFLYLIRVSNDTL